MAALSRAAWLLLLTYALLALLAHLRAESLADQLSDSWRKRDELRLLCPSPAADRSPERLWRAPRQPPAQPLFL